METIQQTSEEHTHYVQVTGGIFCLCEGRAVSRLQCGGHLLCLKSLTPSSLTQHFTLRLLCRDSTAAGCLPCCMPYHSTPRTTHRQLLHTISALVTQQSNDTQRLQRRLMKGDCGSGVWTFKGKKRLVQGLKPKPKLLVPHNNLLVLIQKIILPDLNNVLTDSLNNMMKNISWDKAVEPSDVACRAITIGANLEHFLKQC